MIYLFRHGETCWNREGRKQGWQNSDLTEKGIGQATANGIALSRLIEPATAFRVVSSPQGRCRQTASLIVASIGLDEAGIEYDDRLKEIGYGQWEGLTESEIAKRDPELWDRRNLDRWSHGAPDGETFSMVQNRVSDWLEDNSDGRIVIAVSHGTTGRILRGFYADLTPEETIALPEPQLGFFRLNDGEVSFVSA